MEVWKYGKPDIIFGFHNFRPFPNFLCLWKMSFEKKWEFIICFFLLLLLNVLNWIVLVGYSNSKSVSTYVFGITTNLYSVYGNIKVTQCQVGREEESACVHGRRGKGLNQCLELTLRYTRRKRCSCSSWWCGPIMRLANSGLLREPVLYPNRAVLAAWQACLLLHPA